MRHARINGPVRVLFKTLFSFPGINGPSFFDKKLVPEIRSRNPGSVFKKEKSLALGTTTCSLPIRKMLLRYQVIPQLAENAICRFHFFC